MTEGRSPAGRIVRAAMALAGLLLAAGPIAAQGVAARIDSYVRQFVQQGRFNGAILVANHDKVVYRKAFGYADAEWQAMNTVDTKFRIGSITKQFTAMLILQLAEEGKLRLDGTVADYLPEYPPGPQRDVTIHQLLTHTSGIPNYTAIPSFFPDLSRDPFRPAEFLRVFDSLPLDFPPGSRWRYSNSGYFVLGVVIERLTGRPYEEVLRERILDPLGLTATGYDRAAPILPRRATGYTRDFDGDWNSAYLDMSTPFSAGAMYSTVEDLYRWDRALDTRKLLSAASYERYLSPQAKMENDASYGYGWVFQRVSRGPGRDSALAIGHDGGINGFSSCNYRVPEDGVAVIWLDNTGQDPELQHGILRILYGLPVDPPRPSVAKSIYSILKAQGVSQALQRYRDLKRQSPADYDFREPELNRLGYHLLQSGRVQDAIAVFAQNVESFPDAFNTYDSLGEAYLAAADTAQAIANYRHSLELNPNNTGASRTLTRLQAE